MNVTRKIYLTAQILRLLQHLTAVLNYAGIKLCFYRIQILLISCITVLLIFLHLPAKAPKGSDFWGDDKPITPFYNSIKLTEEAPAMFISEMVFISGCAAESRTQSQDMLNGNSEFIYNAKNNKEETVPINLESLCDDNPSSRCKQSISHTDSPSFSQKYLQCAHSSLQHSPQFPGCNKAQQRVSSNLAK